MLASRPLRAESAVAAVWWAVCGGLPLALPPPAVAASSPAAPVPCPGDCDADGSIGVDELVTGVGIALGNRPLADCRAFDAGGDGTVGVNELVLAVGAALSGCGAATATLTPHPTATRTASPPATASPTPSGPPTPWPTLAHAWTPAFDAAATGWVMSGWDPGDGSLWAVGGSPERGRLLRQQGGTWSEVDPGVAVPLLNWVHGSGPDDVFVGGNGGTILHFDGRSFTLQATPVTEAVWGLWANAPDDVWAVGGEAGSEGPPFVLRYDGRTWSRVPLPPLQRPRVGALFKVWGSARDDVYMVGQNGALLHYDGGGLGELSIGISQDLIGIWGTGPDNVMVVGGRGTAEIGHFDGVRWTRKPRSRFAGLNGVWMRNRTIAHAVGIEGTVLRIDTRTLEVVEEDPPTALHLHAVFGAGSDAMIAVGGNFVSPETGVALRRRLSDDE